MSPWDVKDIVAQSKILYSQRGYLEHFLVCKEAQKIFDDGYKSKIAGDTLIIKSASQVCDIASSSPIHQGVRTGRSDVTCKERGGAGWGDLSAAERGKNLWEKLKPKPRRRKVASGEDLVQFVEDAVQSGEDTDASGEDSVRSGEGST